MSSNEFNFSKKNNFQDIGSSESGFFSKLFKLLIIILLAAIIAFGGLYLGGASIAKDFVDKFKNSTKATETNVDRKSSSTINIEEYSKTSEGVAAKVLPSIVGLKIEFGVESPLFYTKGISAETAGSGIILDKEGHILTNSHVVTPAKGSKFYALTDAKSIKVVFSDESETDAEIIGVDALTDLAVIKVNKEGLTPAVIGDSDDVRIGQFTMAIGSPLGLGSSVTAGIVSAVNRKLSLSEGSPIFTAIQTDASINEGNSGGALVNAKGEVIGINTLKFAGQGVEGIGFAIPINQTKEISKSLIEKRKVERPELGILGKSISPEIAKVLNIKKGVIVEGIAKEGNAAKAGIQPNDIIIKFNGVDVGSINDINAQKLNIAVDDEIQVEVIRKESLKKETIIVKMELTNEPVKSEDIIKSENTKPDTEKPENIRPNTNNTRNESSILDLFPAF